MKRLASIALVALLFVLPACISRQAAVSKATTPIATNIHNDMLIYIADLPGGPEKEYQARINSEYLEACQLGSRVAIVDTWYGGASGQGIRLWYDLYLHQDPKYDQPWGEDVRQMKLRNVVVFDYLLALGEPPALE